MCRRVRVAYLATKKLHKYKRDDEKLISGSVSTDIGDDCGVVTLQRSNKETDVNLGFDILHNLGPGMTCPILRRDVNNQICIDNLIWGLIPSYVDLKKHTPNHSQLFNKKIESLIESTSTYFDNLLKHNRCVVIVDGFYEWKLIDGKKHPYYIHFPLTAMQIPCLYEDKNTMMKTFSIITSEPCSKLASIHHRQPVFLTDDQALRWLRNDLSANDLFDLLCELQTNVLNNSLFMNNIIEFYPVTPKMTNPAYQEPDCSKIFKDHRLIQKPRKKSIANDQAAVSVALNVEDKTDSSHVDSEDRTDTSLIYSEDIQIVGKRKIAFDDLDKGKLLRLE